MTEGNPQVQPAKPLAKVKPLSSLLVLFLCAGLSVGFIGGFLSRGLFSETPVVSPSATPTPSAIGPSVSITGSVSPTPSEPDSTAYEGWIQYVLSGCEVKLLGPKEFTPGLRGEQGTCGSFTAGSNQTVSNFDTFDGMFMIFMPFLDQKDSSYGFVNANSVSEYITTLGTDPVKDKNRDIKLSEEPIKIANTDTQILKIQRQTLGTAYHIFYKLYGKDYVIIFGGKKQTDFTTQIDLLLRSIESLQANNS